MPSAPGVVFDRPPEYHAFRPSPPASLVPLLCSYAGCERPRRVVDLGCGTGLSTVLWRGLAEEVVGVDPSLEMLAEARVRSAFPAATYRCARAEQTGLESGRADIVVAVQSLHWMEPSATFAEVARLLRPGGVFATVDTRFPPAIHADLDRAFDRYLQAVASSRHSLGLPEAGPRWDKDGHWTRMRESGRFRSTREVQLHHVEIGDAARFVGFARTAASIDGLLARGLDEAALGLADLRAAATDVLGTKQRPWVFGYRVLLGVR